MSEEEIISLVDKKQGILDKIAKLQEEAVAVELEQKAESEAAVLAAQEAEAVVAAKEAKIIELDANIALIDEKVKEITAPLLEERLALEAEKQGLLLEE